MVEMSNDPMVAFAKSAASDLKELDIVVDKIGDMLSSLRLECDGSYPIQKWKKNDFATQAANWANADYGPSFLSLLIPNVLQCSRQSDNQAFSKNLLDQAWKHLRDAFLLCQKDASLGETYQPHLATWITEFGAAHIVVLRELLDELPMSLSSTIPRNLDDLKKNIPDEMIRTIAERLVEISKIMPAVTLQFCESTQENPSRYRILGMGLFAARTLADCSLFFVCIDKEGTLAQELCASSVKVIKNFLGDTELKQNNTVTLFQMLNLLPQDVTDPESGSVRTQQVSPTIHLIEGIEKFLKMVSKLKRHLDSNPSASTTLNSSGELFDLAEKLRQVVIANVLQPLGADFEATKSLANIAGKES